MRRLVFLFLLFPVIIFTGCQNQKESTVARSTSQLPSLFSEDAYAATPQPLPITRYGAVFQGPRVAFHTSQYWPNTLDGVYFRAPGCTKSVEGALVVVKFEGANVDQKGPVATHRGTFRIRGHLSEKIAKGDIILRLHGCKPIHYHWVAKRVEPGSKSPYEGPLRRIVHTGGAS